MGLNPMLQQRSITQVIVTLTKDILELLKELVELLLLERGEVFWQWRLARREEQKRRPLLGGPPRGRLYFALREAEGGLAGDCARHTTALDH